MFQAIRQFASLQDDAAAPEDHYLYFRGIPNPPDDYQAPLGASPNT